MNPIRATLLASGSITPAKASNQPTKRPSSQAQALQARRAELNLKAQK